MAQSISVSKQFSEALSYLLAKEGRGAQSSLSSQQNIDRGYLNAIVKGRKPGSEQVRIKIAAHFNMTYEEMLSLGRSLLAGKNKGQGEKYSIRRGRIGPDRRPEEKKKPDKADKEIADILEMIKPGGKESKISETILKAVEILRSDTNYSDVLTGLIDTFHQAVTIEKDNLKLRNKMNEMEHRLASLEENLAKSKLLKKESA